MAGHSGHNLNISKHRCGCRLPFEQPGVGDGYAGAGPVVSYRLSPEEIAAKYGPPVTRKESNTLSPAKILLAVRNSEDYEEAAEALGVSVHRLKVELGRYHIKPRWGTKKEEVEEEMETTPEYTIGDTGSGDLCNDPADPGVSQATEAAQDPPPKPARERLTREEYLRFKSEGMPDEKIRKNVGLPNATFYALKKRWGLYGLRVDAPTAAPAPVSAQKSLADLIPPEEPAPVKKTLLDIARGKLTLDEYKALKEQGKTDHDIAKQHGIDRDALNRLKREWGIIGMFGKQPGQKATPVPIPDVPHVGGPRLTIAAAMQLRDELVEDIEDLVFVLESLQEPGPTGKRVANSDRVTKMLTWHRDQAQAALERIDAAFAGTEVAI